MRPLFSVIIISSLFKKEEPQGLFKLAIFINLKFSELAFENESIKINRKKNFFTLG